MNWIEITVDQFWAYVSMINLAKGAVTMDPELSEEYAGKNLKYIRDLNGQIRFYKRGGFEVRRRSKNPLQARPTPKRPSF